MTDPQFRQAARFYFEAPPRFQAHRPAFVDQAHEEPRPEPLWLAFAVLLVGLVTLWLLLALAVSGWPA